MGKELRALHNIIIFYFSGTGNTWWAINEFQRATEAVQIHTNVCSIENPSAQDPTFLAKMINTSDIIGFAFPIYGQNIPPIMRSFFQNMIEPLRNKARNQDVPQKPAVIIATAGFINAFGPFAARKWLQTANLRLIGHVTIRLTNNLSTPGKMNQVKEDGAKYNPVREDILEKRKLVARKLLEKLASRLAKGKKYVIGIGPYLLAGVIIRRVSTPKIARNYLSLHVEPERCTNCGICIANCSTKSIRRANGEIQFASTCTACARCYNFCPIGAICFNNQYADPTIYKRYQGPGDGFTLHRLKECNCTPDNSS